MMHGIVQLAYIVATALFIFALHWMNTPATARRGVYAGVAGMLIAVVVTWAEPAVVHHRVGRVGAATHGLSKGFDGVEGRNRHGMAGHQIAY